MRWEIVEPELEVPEFPDDSVAMHFQPPRYSRLLVGFHTLKRGQIVVLMTAFYSKLGSGDRLPLYILLNKYYPPQEEDQRDPENDNNWCIPFVYLSPTARSPEELGAL